MENETKLALIKIIHTLIWVFFNFVIFYMLYAAMPTEASYANKLDVCPLTLIARKYSNSTKDNFSIYLPNWLAKYTKSIYIAIFVIILIITIYQILN